MIKSIEGFSFVTDYKSENQTLANTIETNHRTLPINPINFKH